jgi:cytochrome c oxidase subunit 4
MNTPALPVRAYLVVFATLLALTALTTWIAYQDLGPWNSAVAITIAVVKATLVALFFMGLVRSAPMNRVFLGAAIVWLLLLIGLTFADVATRSWPTGP